VGSGEARWLLIGNSRWHWAERRGGPMSFHHGPPLEGPLPPLQAWAAVGAIPPAAELPNERRLHLDQVPLRESPPWLGIDRALVGWQAWQRWRTPVLVADAGTVLSLTWVDGQGRFRGGRLMAGAGLQWRAMAAGTDGLPLLGTWAGTWAGAEVTALSPWPTPTAEAMVVGVLRGLAAALDSAAEERRALEPNCRLVLTGGDGEALHPLLSVPGDPLGSAWELCSDLALEALMELRPAPDP